MPNVMQFYIDGRWTDPMSGAEHVLIDPSNEEPYATILLGDEADTDAAVAAAVQAFPSWSETPLDERIALVERLLEIYERRADEMAATISREMGAPIDMAKEQQAAAGSDHIKDFLRTAREFSFDRPLDNDTPETRIRYEPVGVCGLITPWNWPMNQITLKVIPALLSGCTMVLKPSENTPLSAMLFAEFLDEAGVPAGVSNLVNGDGEGVGTQLSSHPDIDMISFTGSARAGAAITRHAADNLKRVHLELGGKGANIVFADAGRDAVKRGVLECFNNTGQSCDAPTRMLVEDSFYDEAVDIATAVTKDVRIGPADHPGDHIGPASSKAQFEKIQDMIQAGIDEKARLVAGGTGRPETMNKGYYVRPTVFADVTNDMTIAQEEIFGPVLSVLTFDNDDDALAMANDTDYGLLVSLWTQDPDRQRYFARRLEVGIVTVNRASALSHRTPWGGFKQSGIGRRYGEMGLDPFFEHKTVWIS